MPGTNAGTETRGRGDEGRTGRWPGPWSVSVAAAVVLVAGVVACDAPGRADRADRPFAHGAVARGAKPLAAGVGAPAETPAGGIPFDPSSARAGDRVGEFVVDSVAAEPGEDSAYLGLARFRGEIELTGRTVLHPRAALRDRAICFEPDAASAARLPRWHGDDRRPPLCFWNQGDAVGALGGPTEGIPAIVVVDGFTMHRGPAGAVNSARVLGVVAG